MARPPAQSLPPYLLVMRTSGRITTAFSYSRLGFPVGGTSEGPVRCLGTSSLTKVGLVALFVCHRVPISYHECFPPFLTHDFSTSVLRVSSRPRRPLRSPRPRNPCSTPRSIPFFELFDCFANPDLPEGMLGLSADVLRLDRILLTTLHSTICLGVECQALSCCEVYSSHGSIFIPCGV